MIRNIEELRIGAQRLSQSSGVREIRKRFAESAGDDFRIGYSAAEQGAEVEKLEPSDWLSGPSMTDTAGESKYSRLK